MLLKQWPVSSSYSTVSSYQVQLWQTSIIHRVMLDCQYSVVSNNMQVCQWREGEEKNESHQLRFSITGKRKKEKKKNPNRDQLTDYPRKSPLFHLIKTICGMRELHGALHGDADVHCALISSTQWGWFIHDNQPDNNLSPNGSDQQKSPQR